VICHPIQHVAAQTGVLFAQAIFVITFSIHRIDSHAMIARWMGAKGQICQQNIVDCTTHKDKRV
jgi:hypothetical protein